MKEAIEQALILTKKHEQLLIEIKQGKINNSLINKKIKIKNEIQLQMNLFLNDLNVNKFTFILDKQLFDAYKYLLNYYKEIDEADEVQLLKNEFSKFNSNISMKKIARTFDSTIHVN